MGLDQYLSKKTYVKNWNHQSKGEKHTVTVKKGGKKRTDIDPEKISYIVEEVTYWRKANQIHNWFVQNVQDGEDNCREHYVEKEKLKELVDTCKKVRDSLLKSEIKLVQCKVGWANGEEVYDNVEVYTDTEVAEELLPPSPGFFFGSYEYDKWYLQDIEHTINSIEPLLDSDGEFYYDSSW